MQSTPPCLAGAVYLSAYPAAKVIVKCDKCPVRAKYDKLELLEVGGDRPLTYLLDEIISRKGCDKRHSVSMYDRCSARFENLTK